ncbi:enoyl-CoA hydratase/isomerase family protein [Actinotalea solisilvae]|uniref:enoyl-CoA hydratase/isomerase family protein n=1 Tax=Actinotalea solisilvae TaxID=2072922 RepID=UPI0018F14816|nr:enoyl-CoA hydratase-related protein [Actinotalea solisilvae]
MSADGTTGDVGVRRTVEDVADGGGTVAEVVLDRPARLNTLDPAALAALREALEDLAASAQERGLRGVLLRGEGRAFCAGRDISGVDPATDDAEAFLRDLVHPVLAAVRSVPVPVVAAVQGAALGIGLGLAASADIVYAARSARVGSPFARIGAVLDSGGHALLVDRLGPHRAMDLIVTGELLDGEEAARVGLVSRVVPDEDLLARAREVLAVLAAGPTQSFVQSKHLVARLQARRGQDGELLEAEARAQGAAAATSDYAEGFTAFQQKRPPRFTGR